MCRSGKRGAGANKLGHAVDYRISPELTGNKQARVACRRHGTVLYIRMMARSVHRTEAWERSSNDESMTCGIRSHSPHVFLLHFALPQSSTAHQGEVYPAAFHATANLDSDPGLARNLPKAPLLSAPVVPPSRGASPEVSRRPSSSFRLRIFAGWAPHRSLRCVVSAVPYHPCLSLSSC